MITGSNQQAYRLYAEAVSAAGEPALTRTEGKSGVYCSTRTRRSRRHPARGVGPEAPTLCEGWKTRDLAAHLMIREYRLDAAPGIVIPFFAGHTAKVQDEVAQHTDWNELVDKVASGPPVYSPLKVLDPIANVAEMFIHHEDVRRAQPGWQPRELEPALTAVLRRTLPLMGRMTLAKVPAVADRRGYRFADPDTGRELRLADVP